jgi:streptogramin lyase
MSHRSNCLTSRAILSLCQLRTPSRTASIALFLLGCAISPALHAQTAHFSGVQIKIPSSTLFFSYGVAADANGDVFIADSGTGRVFKETRSGNTFTESVITTGLGSPDGIAVDANGNVYITDTNNSRVLKETLSGTTYTPSTIGTGLTYPRGIAVDAKGNVYISDSGNNRVLLETPAPDGSYIQSTIPTASPLNGQVAIAVDGSGNLYIADTFNGRALKETVSGTSYIESTIGTGLSAPIGIAVDANNNVYISDPHLVQVFKETPSGTGYTQTTVPFGNLATAQSVAVDGTGNVYLADAFAGHIYESPVSANNFNAVSIGDTTSPLSLIFTFDTAGTIGTPSVVTQGATGFDFTDNKTGTCNTNGTNYTYYTGYTCTVDVAFTAKASGARYGAALLTANSGAVIASGFVKGTGVGAQVHFLPGTYTSLSFDRNAYAIATDASSNLYVAENTVNDPSNRVVKETWNGSGYTQTTVAPGLSDPVGVAVDGAGNVYVADRGNAKVTKWAPSGSSYTLSQTYIGLGNVTSLAVDGGGNLYVGSLTYGLILFPAGSTLPYYISPKLSPLGIAIDFNGVLYVTDDNNELITETLVDGAFTQATIASNFNRPFGVTVDSNGIVYVADMFNNRVVKLTRSGGSYSQSTFSVVGEPQSIAFDAAGNFYASGDGGSPIQKLDTLTPPSLRFLTTVTGNTSPAQSVTLANYGNAPLTFPLRSSGSNPDISANFALDTTSSMACPQASTAPATLTPDSSCQLAVSFAPTTGGSLTGSLVLTDNNLNALAPNYATQTIALSGSALQVPTFTLPSNSPVTYGVAPFTLNVITNSNAPITYTMVSGPATISGSTVTITGVGTVVINVSLAPSGNFTGAAGTLSFIVEPIAPTFSFAMIPPQTYGVAPFTVNVITNSNGPITYTIASGPATISGSTVTLTGVGTVVLNASLAPSGNFAGAGGTLSFPVAPEGFSLATTSSASAATTSARSAIYALSLTPVTGKTFPNAITFSVSGLPTGATATFSPTTIAAGSGATSVTLTIQTSSQTARNEKSSRTKFAPIALGVLLLPLAGFKSARNRLKRASCLSCILAIATLSLSILTAGCSGGDSSPPHTYTVVVTARDAATGAQSSTNLSLTVQ